MSQASIVNLRGLSKSFDTFRVLDQIDLDIKEGEFLTLLGPSGCGKTTTLRLIAGFETATAGSIIIGGQPMNSVPPHKRPVNTVFQSYALFPHMSVGDNVAFGLRFDGVPKAKRQVLAAQMLDVVGLADKFDQRPEALSGGQKQRAALARALIKKPSVLLLDEPLSALDAALRKRLQIELKRVQRDTGVTFVYVTHDQEEALTLSDRIVVMDRGRVSQCGTPQEIYEKPKNLFVASFVGQSSELYVRALERIEGAQWSVAVNDSVSVNLTLFSEQEVVANSRLRLVIRPDDLTLVDVNTSATPTIPALVTDVIYVGERRRILAEIENSSIVEFNLPISASSCPEIGAQIALAMGPKPVLAFPMAIGEARS